MRRYAYKFGEKVKICSKCIYDDSIPGVILDENGVCNYCHTMEYFSDEYKTGQPEGMLKLEKIIQEVKNDGKGKEYDCVVGVSGGTDSSYLLVKLVEWGLRPLAVHYDNTWNTSIATQNIKRMLDALKIDLFTYVVDNNEMDDIYMSFLKAGVPELEAPTDLALAEVMYRAASKYNIKYIFEGHSFETEGISPLSTFYFDGMYIKDIHRKYGNLPMKTYPLMTFWRFMRWMFMKRIKRIRPFWYIHYSKKEAREYLTKNYNWNYYGGHHLENRMTAIFHLWWSYRKFHFDHRNLSLAAAVRSGELSRDAAIQQYFENEPKLPIELIEYFKERLKLTDDDLSKFINSENKCYKDFKTYKPYFRKIKPLLKIAVKMNLVPESFYVKYTSRD